MDCITIDGKRYAWDYILKVRRKQKSGSVGANLKNSRSSS